MKNLTLLKKSAQLVCLAPYAISSAYAEVSIEDDYLQEFYGSGALIEIATGVKTQVHKAPAVASVFTAEQIKAMGAMDIDDVLESIPGLHISRSSNGYLPIYTIRGIATSFNPQILMLINGIPITNNFLGNRSQVWGGMPVEAIARIEVIRGPGSALYGADAFAGVINIITKNAEHIQGSEVGGRLGSFDTRSAWLSTAGSLGEAEYSAVIEYYKTEGQDSIIEVDAQTFLDQIFATDASLAPGPVSLGTTNLDIRTELNYQNLTLRAGLQHRDDTGIGTGLAEALDPGARQFSQRWNLDANYNITISDAFEMSIQGAYFDTTQEIKNNFLIFPPGADVGFGAPFPEGMIGNPEVFERHYRLNITGTYSGFSGHTLRSGIGYHLADLHKTRESKNFGPDPAGGFLGPGSPVTDVSDTEFEFLPETDRTNLYLYAQDVWAFAPDWELTWGLRYDRYSDFGSTTNPRMALVWSTGLNLTTKLLYGKAFRAPSFAELGNINNPVALGNPDLKPEVIETAELVFDYHASDSLGLIWNFYRYDWQDIIAFVPDPGASSATAQNSRSQKGYGTELEVNYKLTDSLTLRANLAWSESENEIWQPEQGRFTDIDAPFVPGQQAWLQLNWQASDDISVNSKTYFIGDRNRDPADQRQQIGDYSITDLNLRWQPQNLPVEVALIGRNIFDRDAREPSVNNGAAVNLPNDLPLPGRSVFGEVRFRF